MYIKSTLLSLVASSLLMSILAHKPPVVQLRYDDSILDELSVDNSRLGSTVQELWFDQKLSHSSGPDTKKTWNQRYFVFDQYYKPGGPAFLFIGGEGELDGRWTSSSILTEAAKQHNGVVYGLEHRFYGKSYPKPDLSTENLKHLSSKQALDDLANFAKKVELPKVANSTLKGRPTWIIAGGSYPGNLAAWARLKHPEVFKGAIASSAPVEAKEDFFEYDQQVQRSLASNGGQACLDYYLDVIKQVDDVLFSKNRAKIDSLKEMFSCKNVNDSLFSDALAYVSGPVQYNNLARTPNVKTYCDSLALNATSSDKLIDFARDFKVNLAGKTCEEFVDLSSLKVIKQDSESNMRPWLYQCCTEFGYWQVAPHKGSSAARSRFNNLVDYRKLYCEGLFGPDGPKKPKIQETNWSYSGKNIWINSIHFTNGELDPWMPLSVTKSYLQTMPTYVIKGAAHCADLGLPNTRDNEYVAEAKKRSLELIAKWIKN